MASVLGDLWQVTDLQVQNLQQILNVYYYRVTSVTGLTQASYAAMDTWFQANVIAPVRDIQNVSIIHEGIQIRNLSNGIDFYENAFSLAGVRSATAANVLPPNMTHTFRLIRESLVTRNGYKRYAGVDEADNAGGVSTLSPTLQNAVIAGLKSDVVFGAITSLEPVIVKRPIPTPAGGYQYASIGDAQYVGFGTQNTRKIGRGI